MVWCGMVLGSTRYDQEGSGSTREHHGTPAIQYIHVSIMIITDPIWYVSCILGYDIHKIPFGKYVCKYGKSGIYIIHQSAGSLLCCVVLCCVYVCVYISI